MFLAGDRVYKVKKPVVLPFLDYGSAQRRRELCVEEVRLNRRLAAETYLGVVGIVPEDHAGRLAPADDERAVEWAVEMRRLDEERTLDALLANGRLEEEQIRTVGCRLARFHSEAELAPAERRSLSSALRPVHENFDTLLDLVEGPTARRLAAAQRWSAAFVGAHRDVLRKRAATGRVRDGHGDLRLEHVVLGEKLQIFDCVEFDPELRQIDVAADLAYLVMDLAARGREDLIEPLLLAYRDAGGDPGNDRLVAFYAAYRATVRAKLAYLAGGAGVGEGQELLAVSERFRWRSRCPIALITCGVTASGKSTLANALGRVSGWPVLSSDRVRKELAGLAPTARADPALYASRHNERTYRQLARRAAACVQEHGGTIVDATFRHPEDRRAFAEEFNGPAVTIECRAPAQVLRQRARSREREGDRVSDATAALVDQQLNEFAALDDVAADSHIMVRTDRCIDDAVDHIEALLDARLVSEGTRQ